MTKITILATLGVVILVSIVVSGIAHKRHKEEEMRKLKLKRAKKTATEIEKVFRPLMPVAIKTDIYQLIGKYWTNVLSEAQKLAKEDTEIAASLNKAQQLIDKAINTEEHSTPAQTASEIKAYQYAVTMALNMIRKLPNLGYISSSQLADIEVYMKQQYIEVEVHSHLNLARKFASKDDKTSAKTHFRHAQNKLQQSKVHGKEKNDWVKAISAETRSLLENQELPQESPTPPSVEPQEVEAKIEQEPAKRDAVSQFLNMNPNKKRIG